MKRLFNYLIVPAIILSLCGAASAINIDNFDNDSSIADQSGVADSTWWKPTGEITLSVNLSTTTTYGASAASLKVEYNKTSDRMAYFGAGDLAATGNVHNLSGHTYFSCRVYGKVKIMAKFKKWASDYSTSELSIQEATNETGWTKLTWDYSEIDWYNVDPTNVGDILFYPQPGYKESGTFYLDNLTLGPETADASSNQKNLLLDDFNDGKNPNKFGGTSGIWPDDRVMKTNYFNVVPEQVRGREGYSLQLWYGAEFNNATEPGWWTSLEKYNLSNYSTLSFWVIGTSGLETFRVGLKDLSGQETKLNVTEFLEKGITTAWQKVIVPLEVFSNVNLEQVDNLSITFPAWSTGMLFIDDIVFSSTMTGCSFNNFNDGADTNALAGYQSGLGAGSFGYYADTNSHSGSYCAKIAASNSLLTSTTFGSMIDDFDDGIDPNFFGGINLNKFDGGHHGSTVSYTNAVYRGASGQSLKNEFDVSGSAADDAGIYFFLDAAGFGGSRDCSAYTYLTFWIKSDAAANGASVRIGLKDDTNDEPKYIVTGITTDWQWVSIPMSTFTAINLNFDKSKVQLLSFAFKQDLGAPFAGTVYIDDVEFRPGFDGGWITLPTRDISACEKLTFWTRGTGVEKLRIKLQDSSSDSNEYGAASATEAITIPAVWTKQEIALSNFTGIDRTRMNAIHFITPRGCDIFYIDDIKFEDSASPVIPAGLAVNGYDLKDSTVFTLHNVISGSADSYVEDGSLEAVRFEYSSDGITWATAGTDYDVSDKTYSVGWNASDLLGYSGYHFRAVSQDVYGNETASISTVDHSFINTPVLVYPNPFYPARGTMMLHFLQIPRNAVLKIYTLSAELICTRADDGYVGDSFANDGKISWDGKNNSGNPCASGIYLYNVILNESKYAGGKFVIIK